MIAFGEAEAEEPVAVDLRLGDQALFDRLSRWIDEDTTLFRGAPGSGLKIRVSLVRFRPWALIQINELA